jgi:hypothetical protein
MHRYKREDKPDYIYNTPKKQLKVPSRKRVIRSKYIGKTLVERIIDLDYEPLISIGRYGTGLE